MSLPFGLPARTWSFHSYVPFNFISLIIISCTFKHSLDPKNKFRNALKKLTIRQNWTLKSSDGILKPRNNSTNFLPKKKIKFRKSIFTVQLRKQKKVAWSRINLLKVARKKPRNVFSNNAKEKHDEALSAQKSFASVASVVKKASEKCKLKATSGGSSGGSSGGR